MSERPTIEKKKRRLIRSLRNTPTGWIDLEDYIRTRTRCTASMARKIILLESVRVDSHPVGFKREGDKKVYWPYVEAKHRDKIYFENKVKDA